MDIDWNRYRALVFAAIERAVDHATWPDHEARGFAESATAVVRHIADAKRDGHPILEALEAARLIERHALSIARSVGVECVPSDPRQMTDAVPADQRDYPRDDVRFVVTGLSTALRLKGFKKAQVSMMLKFAISAAMLQLNIADVPDPVQPMIRLIAQIAVGGWYGLLEATPLV